MLAQARVQSSTILVPLELPALCSSTGCTSLQMLANACANTAIANSQKAQQQRASRLSLITLRTRLPFEISKMVFVT